MSPAAGGAMESRHSNAWALGGQAAVALSWLAVVPFLIRFLGSDGYGTYSLIQALIGCLIFVDFGMGVASTRFASVAHAHDDAEGEARSVWTALVLSAIPLVVTIAILGAGAPAVLRLISRGKSIASGAAAALQVALLWFALRSASRIVNTPQLVRLRMELNTAIIGGAGVLQAVAMIGAVMAGGGLFAVFAAMAAVAAIELAAHVIAGARLLPGFLPPRIDRAELGSMARFGAPMFVSYATGVVFQQAEKLSLAYFRTPIDLAHYSAAFLIASVLSLGALAFSQTLVPPLTRLHAQGAHDELRRLYSKVLRTTLAIAAPMAMVMIVLARPFFTLWAGAEYGNASTLPFRILVIGFFVNLLTNIPYHLLIAVGKTDIIGRYHLIETPFYIAAACWLTSQYGAAGAAVAWTLRVGVDAVLFFAAAARHRAAQQ